MFSLVDSEQPVVFWRNFEFKPQVLSRVAALRLVGSLSLSRAQHSHKSLVIN